jgi:glycerol-3-phosphate acyltransferase PlsY
VPTVGYILTLLIAYLLGSIPTGFLVGKARGVDIRTVGSGNIGATNVFRILGKTAGALVLLADAAKGWLAVFVVARFFSGWGHPGAGSPSLEWFKLGAGVAAILGHNYTCWLRFKGGKGIATSAGVLVGLVPLALLIVLGIWIVMFALSRYVSLASICAAFALPFAVWLSGHSLKLIIVTAALAALAIYKHKGNIQRLLKGTENRIGPGKAAELRPTASERGHSCPQRGEARTGGQECPRSDAGT